MEIRTLFLFAGAGLLGVGGILAASTGAAAEPCPGESPTPSPMPQPNCQTGSPLVTAPPPPTGSAVTTLARTAWGEARGEGTSGMQAVLNVIMNRARSGGFPGGTNPASVATARNQFSAWNSNDPNRAKLLSVTTADSQFRTALALARSAIAGTLADLTDGAVYYHESSIATPKSWGKVAETTQIGNHIFYIRG